MDQPNPKKQGITIAIIVGHHGSKDDVPPEMADDKPIEKPMSKPMDMKSTTPRLKRPRRI